MTILRITVRTFQNEEHANMFLLMSQNINENIHDSDLKINVRIIQNPKLKNQITSVWEYDNENHMNQVRSYLSKFNKIPNSLSPKEIVYMGEVKSSRIINLRFNSGNFLFKNLIDLIREFNDLIE